MKAEKYIRCDFYENYLINKKMSIIVALLSTIVGVIFLLGCFFPWVSINRFYLIGLISWVLPILSLVFYLTPINVKKKKAKLISEIASLNLKLLPLVELTQSGNYRRLRTLKKLKEKKKSLEFELELIS